MVHRERGNRLRQICFGAIIFVAGGVLVLGWLQYNGELFYPTNFRENKILGKSASEIIHANGLPVGDSRVDGHPPDGGDSFKLIYFSGFQDTLIRIDHGRAVEIIRSTK